MQLLPKWCITNKYPAILDVESKTVIEQTARVYGAMQTLIDEYNTFADSVNEIIEEYETGATKDNEEFRVALRQEFQDFIDVINLKVMTQDKEIGDRFNAIVEEINTRFADNDEYLKNFAESLTNEMRAKIEEQDAVIETAVIYMKTKLDETVRSILNEMRDNGELNGSIINGFLAIEENVNTALEKVATLENEIVAINGTIEEILAKCEALEKKQTALEKELQFETLKSGTKISVDDSAGVPIISIGADVDFDCDSDAIELDKLVMHGTNMFNYNKAPESLKGTVGNVTYSNMYNGGFARAGSGKICNNAFIWGDGTIEGKSDDLNITFTKGQFIYHRDCVLYFYNPTNGLIVISENNDEENHHGCAYEFYNDMELIAVRFPTTGNGTSYSDILYPMIAEITEEQYNMVDSEENFNPIEWEAYDGLEVNFEMVKVDNPLTESYTFRPVTLVPVEVKGIGDNPPKVVSGATFYKHGNTFGECNHVTGEFLPIANSDEFKFLTIPANKKMTMYVVGHDKETGAVLPSGVTLTVTYYNNSKNGKRFGEFHKCALLCNHE